MSVKIELDELGKTLHMRLMAGDKTASAEIAEAFLVSIAAQLRSRFPNLPDPHLVESAVIDAMMNYFSRPEQYDSNRASLMDYLRLSARGDLLNSLKKLTSSPEIVELDTPQTEYSTEIADDFDMEADILARLSPVWQEIDKLLPDPIDRKLARLLIDRERETSVYAEVLGIANRPPDEQTAIVKQRKDRLKKILQRHLKPSEFSGNE